MNRKSWIKELKEPGFKLIHITDVGYETNNITFKSALLEINDWSNANKDHLPIFINIEAKGSGIGDESKFLRFLGFKKSLEFDNQAFYHLGLEIIESIYSDKLLTAKGLKGRHQTISQKLMIDGLPILNECTGKVIFILQGANSYS